MYLINAYNLITGDKSKLIMVIAYQGNKTSTVETVERKEVKNRMADL